MENDIRVMTRKDFDELPKYKGDRGNLEFDSLIIYPTGENAIHPSGWARMTFVACDHLRAVCRLSGWSDALHLGGMDSLTRDKQGTLPWVIDCTPQGFMRVMCYAKLTIGSDGSSFELLAR